MSRIIIDFKHDDVMQPKPWPVAVKDGTVTSGLGTDDGANLIGFGEPGAQSVTVYLEDVIDDPSRAVGLSPTFAGGASGLFEWGYVVAEIQVTDPSDVAAS